MRDYPQSITSALPAELDSAWIENCLNNLNDSILITEAEPFDEPGPRILWANEVFYKSTGYKPSEVIGKTPRILQGPLTDKSVLGSLSRALRNWEVCRVELLNYRKDGSTFWNEFEVCPVANESGWYTHWISVQRDISQRKRAEESLEKIALYDSLTGLPNRVLLSDRLDKAMSQARRRYKSLCVAFMDLDGFKAVNDSHGHSVGDQLLIALAERMSLSLRASDTLARIGGDEFIALIGDLECVEHSNDIVSRLLKAASDPVNISGTIVQTSASAGLTFYPDDGVDAEKLIRHADQAMYIAKQSGKNQCHVFDVELDTALHNRRESINSIRAALAGQELVLHYQPKVNMRTGKVIGAEALIRWQHPTRGLLPPADFLPLIEGHSLSIDVGEWVIDTALAQVSQWQRSGISLPVSVNISAYQLTQENFPDRLATLLARHPTVVPSYLQIEILETSTIEDIGNVSATMAVCHELGVTFALDDFGTGYSSLSYLKRLPASVIKIDQSFVRDMLDDDDDLTIVKGIVGLAKSFQRAVIAEGVETTAHSAALVRLGCDLGQGYGFARPMPGEDMPTWIASWKERNLPAAVPARQFVCA
ncbi:MAG: EAL domain-containing protein [Halieaceae bacterium]|jgi:diguanylate cyclase (GGDEF)-like protein/PAS domain S-box-containing protein|nr:EAL domain-containing protein [Halieaceae bacterium]